VIPGLALGVIRTTIEQDLPGLAEALERMAARLGPED